MATLADTMSPEQQVAFARGYIARQGLQPTAENMNRAMQMLYTSDVVDPALASASNNAAQAAWVEDPYNIGKGDPSLAMSASTQAPVAAQTQQMANTAQLDEHAAANLLAEASLMQNAASQQQVQPSQQQTNSSIPFVPFPPPIPAAHHANSSNVNAGAANGNNRTGVPTEAQSTNVANTETTRSNVPATEEDGLEASFRRGGLDIQDAEFTDVTGHVLTGPNGLPLAHNGLAGPYPIQQPAPAPQGALPPPSPQLPAPPAQQTQTQTQNTSPTNGRVHVKMGQMDVFVDPTTGDVFDHAGRALGHQIDINLLRALRLL